MIGCRIPLSAVLWAREHFVPVAAQLANSEQHVLGLLANHAGTDLLSTPDGQQMIYKGRYFDPRRCGKDLTLADVTLEMFVGLLSDFIIDQGQTDEEKNKRLNMLGKSPEDSVRARGFQVILLEDGTDSVT
jgi:hypothetical protein